MSAWLLWMLASGFAVAQDTPARVVDATRPAYPQEARDAGVSGEVELLVMVDERGQVSRTQVLRSPHSLLSLAAQQAAHDLVIEPATRDGQPTSATLSYTYRFELGVVDRGQATALASVSGTLQDDLGLPLPNMTAALTDEQGRSHPVVTRDDGSFRANFLPPGAYTLSLDSGTFGSQRFEFALAPGEVMSHVFTVESDTSNEIVVTADRLWRHVSRGELQADEGTVPGQYTLTRADLEATPGALEDVNRVVHALPGIVSDGDMLATFNARGGATTDVVYTLDGVPLANPFHLAGFNSVFNPDMIESVSFHAGAAPATEPAGISAVMAVKSWDGTPSQGGGTVDGAVDLSASSARALLMGELTPSGKLTFAVAARRSYIESYFALLKAANVLDSAFAAPEYSELSARLAWRAGPHHQLMVTALRAGDSMALRDSTDDSLVNFDGAFELENTLSLVSLRHSYTPSDETEWTTVLALTEDRAHTFRDLGGSMSEDQLTRQAFGRTDLRVGRGEHTLSAGLSASLVRSGADGTIEDPAGLPADYNAPLAEYALDRVTLGTDLTLPEVSAYAQEEWDGPLRVRGGVRGTWAATTGELLLSPRAGVSLPLPTGTIPKVAWGLYQQSPRDPRQLDPVIGNPDMVAERAQHLVIGVDQALPLPGDGGVGLVRVEGYHIWLSDLIVQADAPDGGPVYENVGSGSNWGVDTLATVSAGRFRGTATYSLLHATRTNPRNSVYVQTIAPAQDQRHTLGTSLEYALSGQWRGMVRYAYHSGRPVSRVSPAADDTVSLACLNCDRLGSFNQLDLRVEWRRAYEHHRLSFYAELLNIPNLKSDFIPIVSVTDGVMTESMFSHLPMRPFMGLRSDF